jgi:hypothetical protein
MPELEKQTVGSDPLASLHKMSTTAGIASADYVAISNLAIGSVILGVMTSLAVIWPVLAWIAAGGALMGILALRSIRHSNGTLAGTAIAFAGIALSIIFAAAGSGVAYYQEARLRPDKQAIDARVSAVGDAIMKSNYSAAYSAFDPEWRNLLSSGSFQQGMLSLKSDYGEIQRFDPNHRYFFYTAQGSQMCSTRAWIRCERYRDEVALRVNLRQQSDGQWLIVFCDLFRDVDPYKTNPQSPQPGIQ